MVKKQTILYMLVILQHKCKGKTALDVFVGNHLDLLAPPYLEKDYLRYPGGGWGRCTCIVLCILQNMSKCRFHKTNVYGFVVFFLVNWADIIPQKVLFSQFHKLWIYNNVLIYFMQKVYLVNFYTYSFSPEGLFEIRHYKQLS